jgi:hypothetical protein
VPFSQDASRYFRLRRDRSTWHRRRRHGGGARIRQDETDGRQVRLVRSAIEEPTIAVAAVPLIPAARTVSKGTSSPKRAEIDCKDAFGLLLGPMCSHRRSRTARTNRVATILIGHSAAPVAIWPARATTVAEVRTANTSMSSTTQPTSPPTAMPKVQTLARASMRKPSRKIAANTYGNANTYYAYAYAYPGTQTAQLSATPKILTLARAGTRKLSRKVDAFAATVSWPQGDLVEAEVPITSAFGRRAASTTTILSKATKRICADALEYLAEHTVSSLPPTGRQGTCTRSPTGPCPAVAYGLAGRAFESHHVAFQTSRSWTPDCAVPWSGPDVVLAREASPQDGLRATSRRMAKS